MTTKHLFQCNIKNQKEYHKKGFCFSDAGNEFLEVQKIDEPERWEEDYNYDFKIPLLEDDDKAKELAEAMGFVFLQGTYQCINVK